jgi:hypothetical protein
MSIPRYLYSFTISNGLPSKRKVIGHHHKNGGNGKGKMFLEVLGSDEEFVNYIRNMKVSPSLLVGSPRFFGMCSHLVLV